MKFERSFDSSLAGGSLRPNSESHLANGQGNDRGDRRGLVRHSRGSQHERESRRGLGRRIDDHHGAPGVALFFDHQIRQSKVLAMQEDRRGRLVQPDLHRAPSGPEEQGIRPLAQEHGQVHITGVVDVPPARLSVHVGRALAGGVQDEHSLSIRHDRCIEIGPASRDGAVGTELNGRPLLRPGTLHGLAFLRVELREGAVHELAAKRVVLAAGPERRRSSASSLASRCQQQAGLGRERRISRRAPCCLCECAGIRYRQQNRQTTADEEPSGHRCLLLPGHTVSNRRPLGCGILLSPLPRGAPIVSHVASWGNRQRAARPYHRGW